MWSYFDKVGKTRNNDLPSITHCGNSVNHPNHDTRSSQQDPDPATEPDAETDDRESGEGNDDERPSEAGGPPGLEPTRYGDWERNGRCIDF